MKINIRANLTDGMKVFRGWESYIPPVPRYVVFTAPLLPKNWDVVTHPTGLNQVLCMMNKAPINPDAFASDRELLGKVMGEVGNALVYVRDQVARGDIGRAQSVVQPLLPVMGTLRGLLTRWHEILGLHKAMLRDQTAWDVAQSDLERAARRLDTMRDLLTHEITDPLDSLTGRQTGLDGLLATLRFWDQQKQQLNKALKTFNREWMKAVYCAACKMLCKPSAPKSPGAGESAAGPLPAAPPEAEPASDPVEDCSGVVGVDPPPPPAEEPVNQTTFPIRTSFDPNDKTGSAAYGPDGFIQPGTLFYKIEFENDPAFAGAAAQDVFVTDTLDADVDPSTVEFTAFGFRNREWIVPPGLANYEMTIDLRPDGINLLVPVKLQVNPTTRVLKATFRSLDPLSMELPGDFDAGFLPSNDKSLHNGEGFFTYTVHAKAGLPTGTVITNQASIVFDVNAPILTPQTKHTLDVAPPASQADALPTTSGSSATVRWSGTDDEGGAGVASYDIFVGVDGGPLSPWLQNTTEMSHGYTGEAGHTYAFYSIATDNVGHREAAPPTPDTQTTVTEKLWTNPTQPFDVDGDNFVKPLDVLTLINYINSHPGNAALPAPPATPPPYLDVDGDGYVFGGGGPRQRPQESQPVPPRLDWDVWSGRLVSIPIM